MADTRLEAQFELLLRAAGIGGYEREYRFTAPRKWRFDFAWPEKMLAVEIEGGIWTQGRHTRPMGYAADLEKYNAAQCMGWRILRYAQPSFNEPDNILAQVITVLNMPVPGK